MVEKVTVEDLKAMRMNEERDFELPSIAQCKSGKSLAYQQAHELRCKFKVKINYERNILTLKKLPLAAGKKAD